MDKEQKNAHWSANVVLVDGDYVDSVAFNLIVNFERIIGRRIPKADMARWIDCVALDGGLREGDNETQVVFVHGKTHSSLENFAPGNYADELDGKAFSDNLGEFLLSSLPVEDEVSGGDLFVESLEVICNSADVKRVMVIPNAETSWEQVRGALRHVDDEDKRITVFAMQPMAGGNFRQEILGYSLMNALGIRAEEIK